MAKEKIIYIRADNKLEMRDVTRTDGNYLEDLQKLVGGYIEIVHPVGLENPYVLVCNDEGKLVGLPINRAASLMYGSKEHGVPMNGDIVLMKEGYYEGEPDILALDDTEASAVFEWLKRRFPFLKS